MGAEDPAENARTRLHIAWMTSAASSAPHPATTRSVVLTVAATNAVSAPKRHHTVWAENARSNVRHPARTRNAGPTDVAGAVVLAGVVISVTKERVSSPRVLSWNAATTAAVVPAAIAGAASHATLGNAPSTTATVESAARMAVAEHAEYACRMVCLVRMKSAATENVLRSSTGPRASSVEHAGQRTRPTRRTPVSSAILP
jgi:hypothetical protein